MKTKDNILIEILTPIGTNTPDPTGEYSDLFAYLYDKISRLLSIPDVAKQENEKLRGLLKRINDDNANWVSCHYDDEIKQALKQK